MKQNSITYLIVVTCHRSADRFSQNIRQNDPGINAKLCVVPLHILNFLYFKYHVRYTYFVTSSSVLRTILEKLRRKSKLVNSFGISHLYKFKKKFFHIITNRKLQLFKIELHNFLFMNWIFKYRETNNIFVIKPTCTRNFIQFWSAIFLDNMFFLIIAKRIVCDG